MELTRDELETIRKSGDFDKLIGKRETDFLDCKSEIYHFKNDESKYELAKDVSAFGNAQGGYILIGIKTEKSEKHYSDEIVDIRPFKESLCNPNQHLNIINQWIYPKLFGLEAKWYSTKNNSQEGIFVIKIPAQRKYSKPFLITRTQLGTSKFKEVMFGYCERKQEFNDPRSVEEMQQIFRDGLFYTEYIELHFKELKSLYHGVEVEPPSKKVEAEQSNIEKRMKATLSAGGLNTKRAMIISAYCITSASLKTLFSSEPQSIKSKLENPPYSRSNGFNLRTLDTAKIHNGEFCRVMNGDRKILDLYKDGSFIYALKGDEDFLCWAMQGLKINPVVLIESIYDFVLFYQLILEDMDKKPKNIIFRVDFHNFHLNDKKNYLVPYGVKSIEHLFDDELKFASKNDWNESIQMELNGYDIASISYKLVEKIYVYFGHVIEKIPFTKKTNGEQIIDIEQIKSD